MIYLSESALKYAVNICEELPNYRVGIALSRASLFLGKDGYNIMRIIQDTITDIEARFYINGNTLNKIEFSNGSSIQFIPISESSRGYAFSLLIVEYGIDKEFVNCVLRPYEKSNYYFSRLRGKNEC